MAHTALLLVAKFNYKAYNGLEVFLLLFVVSRCAEADVLWLDLVGMQLLIQSRVLFLHISMSFSA